MSKKEIVVLGGGVGGLVVANELRRMLGREHRVLLVERNLGTPLRHLSCG